MKRLIAIITALCILISVCGCVIAPSQTLTNEPTSEPTLTNTATSDVTSTATATATDEQPEPTKTDAPIEKIAYEPIEGISVTYARAALLYDCNKNAIIFAHKAREKIYPASTTKLLTASVALKYVDPSTVFTVGTEQSLVKPHSSICLIKPGHKLRLYDLIMGMMLPSGNDAAYTVAVNVARIVSGNPSMSDTAAVDYFCSLMNQYAAEIGATSSHFTSPEGWHDDNHYTTAYDLLLITRDALQHEEISEVVGLHEKYVVFASGENITWKNTNRLLDPNDEYYYKYAKGIKTGSTDEAGKCLITLAENGDRKVIGIVMGCADDNGRYSDSIGLLSAFCGK